MCCLHYNVLHAKQPWRKLVSGFSFACNKYAPQFTDDKSNDSSMREGIPLDALSDLEGDTNFTLRNQSAMKGQKLGLFL